MTRAFVLDRDSYTCQMCGAVSGEPHQDDTRRPTQIQIGRILAKSLGGSDDAGNLRAICSVCEEGLRNLVLDRPSLETLLIQLRRATGADQIGVLRWLVRKCEKQTAEILQEK